MVRYKTIPSSETLHEFLTYLPETGELVWKPRGIQGWDTRYAGKIAGHTLITRSGKAYITIMFHGRPMLAHRAILVMHGIAVPETHQIDHEDGDGTNNRLGNMKVVTNLGNSRNKRMNSRNKSGYPGVYLNRRRTRWIARNVKGSFDTAEDAYVARQKWQTDNGYHPNHGAIRPL
jgi:hypothetical protein